MRSFLVRFCCSMMLAISAGGVGMSLQAQETKMTHAANVPMVHMPGTPGCFVMAAQQGDPGKEASILKMKGSAGCAVPWHWHPSAENIMMVSGTARTAVKDEKPIELAAGSFLSVPPKHVMNFACVRECTLFVYTDGPFAVHYVDETGKEITPDEALKKK
jgi:quercetin dioxygenase-like cupin family protein